MTPEEIAADEAQTARNENAANRYAKCQRLGVNSCGYEIVDGQKYYDWEWMDPQEYEEIMAIVEDPSIRAEDVELHPYIQWQEDLIFQQNLEALYKEINQEKKSRQRREEQKLREKRRASERQKEERKKENMDNAFGNYLSFDIEDCLFEYQGKMGFSAKDVHRLAPDLSDYKLKQVIHRLPRGCGIKPVVERGPHGRERSDWFIPEEMIDKVFGEGFRASARGESTGGVGLGQTPEGTIPLKALSDVTRTPIDTLKADARYYGGSDAIVQDKFVREEVAGILAASSGRNKSRLKEDVLKENAEALTATLRRLTGI